MQETQDIKSKRITLLSKEKYKIDLEYNNTYAILHLPFVDSFNKELFLESREVIRGIETFLKDMGYQSIWAAISPDNKKTQKLAENLGFEFRGSSQGWDVYERKK